MTTRTNDEVRGMIFIFSTAKLLAHGMTGSSALIRPLALSQMGDGITHCTDSGVEGEHGAVDDKQLRITMSITKQTQFPLRRKPHRTRNHRVALSRVQ